MDSKAARKIPKVVWPVAQRKLDVLNAAASLQDLAARVFAPSAEFWMNLQAAHDIWHAQRKVG